MVSLHLGVRDITLVALCKNVSEALDLWGRFLSLLAILMACQNVRIVVVFFGGTDEAAYAQNFNWEFARECEPTQSPVNQRIDSLLQTSRILSKLVGPTPPAEGPSPRLF